MDHEQMQQNAGALLGSLQAEDLTAAMRALQAMSDSDEEEDTDDEQ